MAKLSEEQKEANKAARRAAKKAEVRARKAEAAAKAAADKAAFAAALAAAAAADADQPAAMREAMAASVSRGLGVRPCSQDYPRDSPHTFYECGEKMRRVPQLAASEAKDLFFLTPADLKAIPHALICVGHQGAKKCWASTDLREFALSKHGGHAAFQKKADTRAKRAATKRQREQDAKAHRQGAASQKPRTSLPVSPAHSPAGGAAAATVGPSHVELARARAALQAALQGSLTWDYMRSKRSPHGCWIVGQVPSIAQHVYATLIGEADDPQLKGLVKQGAWYSATVPFSTVFGADARSIHGRGGRYNGNADLVVPNSALCCRMMIEHEDVLQLKYCPGSKRLSIGAEARHLGLGLGGKSDGPLSSTEVDDLEKVKARMRAAFPNSGW